MQPSWVLAQPALQAVLQEGIKEIKADTSVLDHIFRFYLCPPMDCDYGQSYIDKIKVWFTKSKIPVFQAWSIDPQRVPMLSVRLASESEDESKAAIGDYFGQDDMGDVGVNVFNVSLDLGIHGRKDSDEVLWLYYITSYILFKKKAKLIELGLQLTSHTATDLARSQDKLPDNIFTRWIRLTATVQNYWQADPFLDVEGVEVNADFESSSSEVGESILGAIDID